ncbi:hypothetical protein BDZ45DRAFT_100210 [Acephala macrosclerotiorum]|nr:hypothetical protein BDZ45DRAFT_100210 [Acephala macrosclerotiorum]
MFVRMTVVILTIHLKLRTNIRHKQAVTFVSSEGGVTLSALNSMSQTFLQEPESAYARTSTPSLPLHVFIYAFNLLFTCLYCIISSSPCLIHSGPVADRSTIKCRQQRRSVQKFIAFIFPASTITMIRAKQRF